MNEANFVLKHRFLSSVVNNLTSDFLREEHYLRLRVSSAIDLGLVSWDVGKNFLTAIACGMLSR